MTFADENPTANPPPLDAREIAWAKFPNDALVILDDAPPTHCGSPLCGAPVWRGLTRKNERRTVFDIKPDGTRTGTNHWRTCLDRDRFKR